MNPTNPRENAAAAGGRRQATVMESVEEIRALSRRRLTAREEVTQTVAIGAPSDAAELFRPVERPTMALLTVFDDGDDAGELIRIRASTFMIGRVEGDLVIPHDGGISGRHAELSRRIEGSQSRWYLRDLQSTNGTFVRAATVILLADQEVLIGRGRFRFDAAAALAVPEPAAVPGPLNATRKLQGLSPGDLAALGRPSLVEMTPRGEGRRYVLGEPEVWIGRDPNQCTIVLNDATVDPRHARVHRDAKGRWVLENARSTNGLWVRVQEILLDRGGQFQCGEQRFAIKIL